MKLSVIIPVHNQEKIIANSLHSLLTQDVPKNFYELIVIDDNSRDNTKKLLKIFQKRINTKLMLLETAESQGRAAARNLGIKKAQNEIVVLLDGDIIASKVLLKNHLKWHKRFPKENFSVMGFITWSPQLEITPFMHWLEHGGRQLDFGELVSGGEVSYKHFYTGNSSFKKSFLLKNGLFDEDFGQEMYEDLEFAYRLGKKGLKIYYNKKAIGYHFHPTNPTLYSKRMLRVGGGAKVLFKKHPELRNEIALTHYTLKTILNQILSPAYFIIGKIFRSLRWTGFYYNAKFFRKYMEGFKKNE